jgi:guanosine-3',5'-bis(diphosphate) 3'-pyrophosphohydrolase
MRVDDIIETVQTYSPDADIDLIMRAYVFSAQAHNGQMRKSGEDYLIHPLAVAGILADMKMDVDTIATGLLHDTMEDCLTTHEALVCEFGVDVADMVAGVTKIGKLQFRTKQEAQAENFRKLILAMSRDVRVILVKLADRLHNMQTMEHMRPDRQAAISQETMDIFAPIANRLGLSKIKSDLEDLCFRYLHPDIYADLTEQLQERAPDHQVHIEQMRASISAGLTSQNLQPIITGRVKHIVSVHRKMKDKNLDFDQVHDLLAFRLLTDDLGQCYTALGVIHSMYPHIPDKLKDYIAQPKSNGYKSLHTVIVSPGGQEVEVQIRTHEMHNLAESGIAAHWRYKEGHLALSKEEVSKIARLRTLFEVARDISDPDEFMEMLKIDLFSDEIFVFTPKGDVKFFPAGTTALDFAYAIHTEIGNTCTGAKSNSRIVPLRYQLQNGDRLEVLTNPSQRPSRDWLNIAKTGRALSKIRRALHEEEREKGRQLGREMLESELKKHNLTISRITKNGQLDQLLEQFNHARPEQLYLDIAQGHTVLQRVITEIIPEEPQNNPITSFINRIRKRAVSPVLISGEEDVLTNYARCCNPLPGEPVVGYITRGRGITVHKSDCRQLEGLEPERRVEVQWHKEARHHHSGEIEIFCNDKPGMLAEITALCKTREINIGRMSAEPLPDDKASLKIEVAVRDVKQLKDLIRALGSIRGVHNVTRR